MSRAYPDHGEIVITGAGAVCSLGNSVPEIWERLLSAKPGFSPLGDHNMGELGIPGARVSTTFEIGTDIHPQLAKSMGKHLSLLLKSAEEAFDTSALKQGNLQPEEIGFFAGMGMVDYRVEDLLPAVLKSLGPEGELDYEKFFSRGHQEIYPLWSLGMLNNVAFCQAAIHLGIRGENCVFCPHADSGILAVAEGVKVLREKKANAVLAGGISEEISPLSLVRAGLAGLIGLPQQRMQEDADGEDSNGDSPEAFLGECGAMLVIEPLDAAESRGAKPVAKVKGFGFSCERGDKSIFPSSQAVASAMDDALSQARVKPGDIDLMMIGSAGRQGSDELEAIRKVFGNRETRPVLISSSRAVGEVFAASPVLDAIIGVKIFEFGLVPECLCVEKSNGTECFQKRGSGPGRILINSVSYEGQCASMVMEAFSRQ
jgi:3-oxoacyl-[acyl-carrier-protein] synthase II